METTRVNRQKWIKDDSPSIDEVVNKFPHLASMKMVKLVHLWHILDIYSSDATGDFAINSYKSVLNNEWLEWRGKINKAQARDDNKILPCGQRYIMI